MIILLVHLATLICLEVVQRDLLEEDLMLMMGIMKDLKGHLHLTMRDVSVSMILCLGPNAHMLQW